MPRLILSFAIIAQSLLYAGAAAAHGTEPHPKCKRGYIVNDDHRCVKAPQ
jgi:hypothetical protein